jgi:hypothetical protein
MPRSRAGQLSLVAVQQQNLTLLASLAGRRPTNERYDVVHCFGWEAGLASGLLCEMLNIPLVATVSDALSVRTPWLSEPQHAYRRYVLRWLLRRCRRILCPDDYTLKKLEDLFLIRGEDMIVLTPLWSDPDEDGGDAVKDDPGPNIFYPGPVVLTRGLQELLRAVAGRRRGDLSCAKLLLCGTGRSAVDVRVRSLVRRLHLADRAVLLPPPGCPRSWDRILSRVNLMILPDAVEFIGNVVLRALQRGIPVLMAGCEAAEDLACRHYLAHTFGRENGNELGKVLEDVLFQNTLTAETPGVPVLPDSQTESREESMGLRLRRLYRQLCVPGTGRSKGGEKDGL